MPRESAAFKSTLYGSVLNTPYHLVIPGAANPRIAKRAGFIGGEGRKGREGRRRRKMKKRQGDEEEEEEEEETMRRRGGRDGGQPGHHYPLCFYILIARLRGKFCLFTS